MQKPPSSSGKIIYLCICKLFNDFYAMYRQVLTPDEQNNTIVIPREWYGRKIEVVAFPVVESGRSAKSDATPLREQRLREIRAITNDIRVDLSNFKFNRDEANSYD
jgi:hypothetical protein